ncbi:hypothetical protein FLACOL_01535 [Flavobacterium columnare]|uniref:Lantibiotic dehydratase n=1 Tax=Flavobacterium columnare TaxID=996 RepID=A0A2N9PB13_9FLAO|nr:lantibiotic dehydratase [Flavobacterium columnare]SPE77540.1 hypothetical protein FLACOL_01535 [Flavobacterium columnare]
MEQRITPIKKVFLRTPFYPLEKYTTIPSNENELLLFIDKLWENTIFKEAVFIASPELYYEWKKIIENISTSKDKIDAVSISLLKYFVRATTRPTPFGLFSSYSNINALDQKNNEIPIFSRFVSMDTHFLYSLTRKLNNDTNVRNILKYNVNNSLYQIGEDYRYVEVSLKHGKRNHVLTSLEKDEVLVLIFDLCEIPKSIIEIAQHIVENVENVTTEDASIYVNDLINAQILTSDLEICLNKVSPLDQLLNFYKTNVTNLSSFENIKDILEVLFQIDDIIHNQLEKNTLGNAISVYEKIFELVDKLNIPYEKKYLINTNLQRQDSPIHLSENEIKNINKALQIVSKFTTSKTYNNSISAETIQSFKEKFYKRYEENEVPLVIALDNEIGINYSSKKDNSFSELIDDLNWNDKEVDEYEIKYNKKIHAFWTTIFLKALTEAKYEIDLKEYDLSTFEEKTNELARSFSTLVNKTEDKIIFDLAGGSSALDTITRFSNSDHSLKPMIDEIVSYEQFDSNILYSEILHIPDDRQGNVLLRNIDRNFETPFLTKSTATNQIKLEDINVCIKNDRVILKSVKHNKEIRFYNTTAHNFYFNSLPIYQFISDLQYQDILGGISLNFGDLNKKTFKFKPRITYGKDIVLSLASWELSSSDFDSIKKEYELENVKNLLISKNVPEYFFLTEGDNQLLIDLNNPILLKIVFEEIVKGKTIVLKECIYDIAKDKYCNEIVLTYINNQYKQPATKFESNDKEIKRTFVPGDEWLYYKIYTGRKTADKILIGPISNLVGELKQTNTIDSWFFIRFNDPEFHIRLRFKINKNQSNATGSIMKMLNSYLKPYVDSHMIWKIEMDTYQRELERYEWDQINFCENFFNQDSEMLTELMTATKNNGESNILWILSLKCIDEYLNLFNFSIDEKYKLMNQLYLAFQEEFDIDKKVKKQIDLRFRANSAKIKAILKENIASDEYFEIINKHIQIIKVSNIEKTRMNKIMISLIHMHINRVITANPRAHELILYSFFEKYYRQELGKLKHVPQIN